MPLSSFVCVTKNYTTKKVVVGVVVHRRAGSRANLRRSVPKVPDAFPLTAGHNVATACLGTIVVDPSLSLCPLDNHFLIYNQTIIKRKNPCLGSPPVAKIHSLSSSSSALPRWMDGAIVARRREKPFPRRGHP